MEIILLLTDSVNNYFFFSYYSTQPPRIAGIRKITPAPGVNTITSPMVSECSLFSGLARLR